MDASLSSKVQLGAALSICSTHQCWATLNLICSFSAALLCRISLPLKQWYLSNYVLDTSKGFFKVGRSPLCTLARLLRSLVPGLRFSSSPSCPSGLTWLTYPLLGLAQLFANPIVFESPRGFEKIVLKSPTPPDGIGHEMGWKSVFCDDLTAGLQPLSAARKSKSGGLWLCSDNFLVPAPALPPT